MNVDELNENVEPAPQNEGSSEFEREPVPKSAMLGFKSFTGMYAGEHCAGTELMIGPLFVAAFVYIVVSNIYQKKILPSAQEA